MSVSLKLTEPEPQSLAVRPKRFANAVEPEVINVVWEWWKAGYERSYHGPAAVVDLGEIDDD